VVKKGSVPNGLSRSSESRRFDLILISNIIILRYSIRIMEKSENCKLHTFRKYMAFLSNLQQSLIQIFQISIYGVNLWLFFIINDHQANKV
jgi:hypothetical protein